MSVSLVVHEVPGQASIQESNIVVSAVFHCRSILCLVSTIVIAKVSKSSSLGVDIEIISVYERSSPNCQIFRSTQTQRNI